MQRRRASRSIGRAGWYVAMMAAAALYSGGAMAQVEERGDGVLDLPRPGYEAGRWRIGNLVLMPQLTAEGHYDSNVFATSTAEQSDLVVNATPRLDIVADGLQLDLKADIEANARVHGETSSEDSFTFGGGVAAAYAFGSGDKADGRLRFDRAVESRADPEANPSLFEPAKLDALLGDTGFKFGRGRIVTVIRAGVQQIDYLDPADDDRDLTNYNASLRLGWIAAPPVTLFVQGYGQRRDARLPVDRSGVDRDATTIGILGGVMLDISGRWRGELGAGAFRANPDGALASFSGLAVNGRLVWTPTARLAMTLQALSGDAATIRAGANGRIDSKISLRVDAEARHNLLLHAGVGFEKTSYRGGVARRLDTWAAEAEAELLLGRALSLFARVSQTSRDGTTVFDRFDRTTAGLGLKVRL